MIEIKFSRDGGCTRVEVTGHAGAAEKGKDIICAGASMLFFTLAACIRSLEEVEAFQEPPVVRNDDGNGRIEFRAQEDWAPVLDTVTGTIELGFRLLANEYPDAVSMLG